MQLGAHGEPGSDAAESKNLCMSGNSKRENREIPSVSCLQRRLERSANTSGGNADMNADGKSDGSIVPAKPTNNDAPEASANLAEERDPTKRNAEQANLCRTQSRVQRRSRGLSGVRRAARKDSALRFTALLHHVDEQLLTESFYELKRNAAVGIDGVTWHEYECNLEENIRDLCELGIGC